MTSCQFLPAIPSEQIERAPLQKTAGSVRVLTITPFYPSAEDPSQGGFISEPVECMKAFGISHRVVAVQPLYRRHVRSAEDAPAEWVPYFSIPSNFGLASAGRFVAMQLTRQFSGVRRTPFDLIHAHAALPCGHAALLLSKRFSIPYVVTAHGLDVFFTRQTGSIFGEWCERVAKEVYRSARVVVCISEKVRERILDGVRAHTTVIYNGVNAETFSPAKRAYLPATVLSVGNLLPTKGHALLFRAFADVAATLPKVRLELIGDGPERRRLSRLAMDLGIADKVTFRGRQNAPAVIEAMRRCSLFVLPSSYEGLGCVYLEAMASAKPAIGCYGQGIDEIIENGKSGMLVNPDNIAELAGAMCALLQNEELRTRMGACAREIVLRQFTLQHQAQQLAGTYRRCIA